MGLSWGALASTADWLDLLLCLPFRSGRAMRGSARPALSSALGLALVLFGCTKRGRDGASRPAAEDAASGSPVATAASTSSAGAEALRAFRSGETRLRTKDGASWMLGKRPGACAPLPPKRPAGFHVRYALSPTGDVLAPALPTYFSVAEGECEVFWSHLHLGRPEVVCSSLGASRLDALYARMRALEPHTIRTRRLEDDLATIHRGGFHIAWHWPGHMCEISDARDSEVLEADEGRFAEIVGWLKEACVTHGHAECAGVPR